MKRILLACCLLAATCTVTYTQSQAQSATPARPAVSKTDYTARVGELKTLLDAGKTTEAKAKWDEVHKMLLSALGVTKFKIRDAIQAHNDADKTRYTDVMINQRNIYSDIIKMRDDLATNKVSMNEKLTTFGATIE